ncbi:hypothetical protein AACH28_04630 [Sphingobacterium thalpophilum]|uniref:Uncharacterized protein n=1 Tax=Sphingobacterium thalpophilum TaxID=259 RepID=A0ACD5C4P9_9SPHI
MVEISKPKLQVNRNLAQILIRTAPQKIKVLEGARAVGKSTVLADEMSETACDMPRSTNFLQGRTYQQILTRTLPSTILSLETLGYKNGIHFTIGQKPIWKKYNLPYEPPLDWGKTIAWWTGAVWVMLSQDVSSRGINTCSGLADEYCELDPVKFQAETYATLRGGKSHFEHKKRWLSQVYVSSIPRTQEGKHIYTYEQAALTNPDEVFYLRAPTRINAENLPDNYFKMQRRIMSKYEYDIEIENIRPRAVGGGFYPAFNERNLCYDSFDNDYLRGLVDEGVGYDRTKFEKLDCREVTDIIRSTPLDIALDYGKFCCIVTAQETFLNECNFLSSITPEEAGEMLEILVQRWCDYYQPHPTKRVSYWYDQTAIGKDGRSPKTYADIVVEVLIKNGWDVDQQYYGAAPEHSDKYKFWSIAMRNDHPLLPIFKWNRTKCKYLIESINNSAAKEGKFGPEKVKTDERKTHVDQRYTTHQGDAMDMIGYFKYSHLIESSQGLWLPSRSSS